MSEEKKEIKLISGIFKAYKENVSKLGTYSVSTKIGFEELGRFLDIIIASNGTYNGLGIDKEFIAGEEISCVLIHVIVPENSVAAQYITGKPIENKIQENT